MRKKRDYQAYKLRFIERHGMTPYQWRTNPIRLKQLGISRSQARGHAAKGELSITQTKRIALTAKKNPLFERVRLHGTKRAIELYKCAERQNFERRTSRDEPPTCLDLLLQEMADKTYSEFPYGLSPDTIALDRQLKSGRYKDMKQAQTESFMDPRLYNVFKGRMTNVKAKKRRKRKPRS